MSPNHDAHEDDVGICCPFCSLTCSDDDDLQVHLAINCLKWKEKVLRGLSSADLQMLPPCIIDALGPAKPIG